MRGERGRSAFPRRSGSVLLACGAVPFQRWTRVALLLVALVAGLAATIRPGPLSIDEVTYLLMARSFAQGHGVVVANGFEDLGTTLFAAGWTKEVAGGLVSQYPDFWTAAVAPVYSALGFEGLFWVNVVAFVGCLGLVWNLGVRLFEDRWTAGIAVTLFVGASYAWEYAVAAWPHMSALLLILVSTWCLTRAFQEPGDGRRWTWSFLGGFVGGVGVGFRLDVAFAVGGLALVPLLSARPRWREVSGFLVAAALPLVGLAVLNRIKFGILSPFSYGPSVHTAATGAGPYLPVLAAVGAAVGFWAWYRAERGARTRAEGRRAALAAALLAVLVVASLPMGRSFMARLADGTFQLVVDLRVRDLGIQEGALERGPTGSLVYAGVVKKSLLQSLPYLPLAILPLTALLRRSSEAWKGLLLAAAPAALIVVMGAFAWHGGLCFNLRYFLPALPFAALLSAAALRELGPPRGRGWLVVVGLPALVALAVVGRWALGPMTVAEQETFYLNVPLGLSGLLILFLIAARFTPSSARWRTGALAMALVCVTWAGLVAFGLDLRATLRLRGVHARAAAVARPALPERGVLLSTPLKLFAAAADRSELWLADPADDQYESLVTLVEKATAAGLPVYYGLPRGLLRIFEDPKLQGLRIDGVLDGRSLVLVSLRPDDRPVAAERSDP